MYVDCYPCTLNVYLCAQSLQKYKKTNYYKQNNHKKRPTKKNLHWNQENRLILSFGLSRLSQKYVFAGRQRKLAPCFRHLHINHLLFLIAHPAHNVNFAAQNVKRRRAANRSETAGRWTKTQRVRHGLGERKSCKRYRKSCNA